MKSLKFFLKNYTISIFFTEKIMCQQTFVLKRISFDVSHPELFSELEIVRHQYKTLSCNKFSLRKQQRSSIIILLVSHKFCLFVVFLFACLLLFCFCC